MPVLAFSSRKSAYHGPDPQLAKDQLTTLQTIAKAFGIERFCALAPVWILRKKADTVEEDSYLNKLYGHWNKRLVPFRWNRMQSELYREFVDNNIVLKYRQAGTTTWMLIVRLWLAAVLEPGTSSLLISQSKSYGAAHFYILKRANRHFLEADPFDSTQNTIADQFKQNLLHTEHSNRHELIYDQLDSRIVVDTAENTEVGQGLPGITHLGCTEVARWPHKPSETISNPSESVVPGGTRDWESTANGMGGLFFEEYQAAKQKASIYKAHFYPWPYAEEYQETKEKEQKQINEAWEKTATELDRKEEEAIKQRFQLELSRVIWRRGKKVALKLAFYEKYPEDDTSAFLTSGRPFFDAAVCRQAKIELPLRVRILDENLSCGWRMFHPPVPGRSYVIGADSAEGRLIKNDEPDFSDFVVLDEETGLQMGRYHHRIPPEDYAYDMLGIAKLFNNALVGVERNPGGGGETVLVTLVSQLGYHNIFMYKEWSPVQKQVVETPGMPTTPRTRKLMLNKLAFGVRTEPQLFEDELFWDQAMTFAYDEKGKPAAMKACFDDMVMAHAIGHFVRLVRLGFIDPLAIKGKQKYGEEETP